MPFEEKKQAPTDYARREAFELTAAHKRDLLQLARNAIAAYIAGLPLPSVDLPELDQIRAGIFVSLHIGEQLRGCIGYVEAVRPLPEALRETAISAAARDPRFEPLTADELEHVKIEISILSPLRKIESPADITLGRHGVMVQLGHYHGLLLPQVTQHHDWDVETFLAHVCLKAGLPAEAWKDPEAEIFIFEAEVFSEANVPPDSVEKANDAHQPIENR
jgi:AmmeMemoRadiSam system protein A